MLPRPNLLDRAPIVETRYLLRRLLNSQSCRPAEDFILDSKEAQIDTVTLDSLQVVVQRNIPSIDLPMYLTNGMEEIVEGISTARRVRQSSQKLTDMLKERSRSTARGGSQELDQTESDSRLRTPGKKKVSWRETQRMIQGSGIVDLYDGVEEELQDMWSATDDKVPRPPKVAYGIAETLGYAAARMPACYSVAYRVFDELGLRLPYFRPQSLLDFGSGPGTAIWAASEVWEDLKEVHAVEPSPAMRWLGSQVEELRKLQESGALNEGTGSLSSASGTSPNGLSLPEDQDEAFEIDGEESTRRDMPAEISGRQAEVSNWTIRWLHHLRGFQNRKTAGRKLSKHAMVQSTGKGMARENQIRDISGGKYSRVSEARAAAGDRRYTLVVASYSLGELETAAEQRKALKALWQATGDLLVIIEPGTPSGSAFVRAARAQILDWETDGNGCKEAHIIAPCPHDGRCPMDGTKSWCHFSQRFVRTRLLRQAKIKANKPLPRSYQDERFSYVVIRRGRRNIPSLQVALPDQLAWREEAKDTKRIKKAFELSKPVNEDVEKLISASLAADTDEDISEEDIELANSPGEDDNVIDGIAGTGNQYGNEVQKAESEVAPSGDGVEFDYGALHLVVMASQQWSRIIRRSRKRPGHFIVDVCSASGLEGEPGGRLVRQSVSSRQRPPWLTAGGHRLAKKLDWGDLWPPHFQKPDDF